MALPPPFRLALTLLSTFAVVGTIPATGGTATLPVPPAAAPQDAPAAATTVAKAQDGLFYLVAQVNDVPVRFVVDTGANVVVLTPEDAARVGLAVAPRAGQRLRTANGTAAMRETRIARLRLAGRDLHATRAVIAGGPPTSLLGQTALAQLESVTMRGGRLELR